MIQTREQFEAQELKALAPYAATNQGGGIRRWPEEPHAYRTAFQRDRDRILYCRAFRRLEYKTQVFVNWTADHYRTRLTHTMEMAAIGRTLARALRVNEDLTEAIALAHDIGHSPFGHCGERMLDRMMQDQGGFDHNIQSLRWVEILEVCYPDFPGLNLTWEVRAGLRKHLAADPRRQLDDRPIGPFQYIEAQIADLADDIAYQAHDVDDGLESGLIDETLLRTQELWCLAEQRVAERFPNLNSPLKRQATLRALLDLQVENCLQTSAERLEKYAPTSPEDAMQAPERLVAFSPELEPTVHTFRSFLFENLYWHPDVVASNQEAVDMLQRLFEHYLEHPDHMGRKARERLETEGLWRTVCDYVSGFTDRYALEEGAGQESYMMA
jgi:dGTPase